MSSANAPRTPTLNHLSSRRASEAESEGKPQSFRRLPRGVGERALAFELTGAHERLADVEMELHRLQRVAPPGLKREHVAADLLRQAQALQLVGARFQRVGEIWRAVRRFEFGDADAAIFVELAGDQEVEPRRPVRQRLAS